MNIATTKRTSIDVDIDLLEEAVKLSGLSTNKSVINKALAEFVEKRRKKNLMDIKGQIEFAEGYNYKTMRQQKDGVC